MKSVIFLISFLSIFFFVSCKKEKNFSKEKINGVSQKGPFVNVGDDIEVGKPVCIIEAMKLFNEIESEVKGKIVKVLVDDATPVEYDQPLFLVDPS